MIKLVSNQINPNFTSRDALFALGQIRNISKQKTIDFSGIFGTPNYHLLNAARSGLGLLAQNLCLPKNKRIGIPAFICGVVATPFLEAGYQIEWIDTDENGLIDFEDFKQKSENISLVICPHIFGQKIKNLRNFYTFCQEKNIVLVEDCAHAWEMGDHESHYDFRILSFGREKIVSCVSGGALLWNKDSKWAQKISSLHVQKTLSKKEIIKHLIQPFVFSIALPWWHVGGKIIPWFFLKINALPKAVSPTEKSGREDLPITTLPYSFQKVIHYQTKKHAKVITHKKTQASEWKKGLEKVFPKADIKIPENFFRIILKTKNSWDFHQKAKKAGFFLREWDGVPISPKGVDLKAFGYIPGSCPNAESFAKNHITLPTNIRTQKKDIQKLLNIFSKKN